MINMARDTTKMSLKQIRKHVALQSVRLIVDKSFTPFWSRQNRRYKTNAITSTIPVTMKKMLWNCLSPSWNLYSSYPTFLFT